MAMFVVSCVLKASRAVWSDMALILMGVGRFLGALWGSEGHFGRVRGGFGLDFGVCARPRGVYGGSWARSLKPISVGKPSGRPKIKKK